MEGKIRGSINILEEIVNIYHGSKSGDVNELIDRNYLDPISGFPGYKSYFCRVERKAQL